MRSLRLPTGWGQVSSLTLLVHSGSQFPELPGEKLPTLSADHLSRLWRELDDLPPNVHLRDGRAAAIAKLGYKVCRAGLVSNQLRIPRGSVLIASRDPLGRITGLQTDKQWLTCPQIHCVNLIRKTWTQTIEVYPSIVAADVAALERNVAAICLNGFEFRQLSQHIIGSNPVIVSELEAAA
jgi:hypothetical protein